MATTSPRNPTAADRHFVRTGSPVRTQDAVGDRPGVVAAIRLLLERPLTPFYLILGATVLLTTLGLVMVLSASSVESYVASGSSWAVAQKQAVWVAIGVPVMVVASEYELIAAGIVVVDEEAYANVLMPE